jgi:transcriptional regulator
MICADNGNSIQQLLRFPRENNFMYHLPQYKENDRGVLIEFMKQHSFAMLIGSANNIPAATQIPILIEEREEKIFLKGHFMRNTDHHKAFEANPNALCIFTGPHSYISASWYTNKQTASTWNYTSVHVRGEIKFLGHEKLIEMLEELSDHYEGRNSPSSYSNLSTDYVERLSKAIIGFEIEAKEIDGIFKLSQNRDETSYDNIIHELKNKGEEAREIGDLMEQRKSNLFPS